MSCFQPKRSNSSMIFAFLRSLRLEMIRRMRTVHYGKHSLRFFGPFLWGRLSSADRKRSSLNSFKQSINKKDPTVLVDECKNFDVYIWFLRLLTLTHTKKTYQDEYRRKKICFSFKILPYLYPLNAKSKILLLSYITGIFL